MNKSLKLLATGSVMLLLLNCKGKDGATGPKGEDSVAGSESVKKGTTSGYAHLLDEFGKIYSKGDSGIKVILSGSDPEIAVVTDKNGSFSFDNVKTGVYDILLKKEGFPDYQYPRFIVLEGPRPLRNFATIGMNQQSTTVLSTLKISFDSLFVSRWVKFRVNVSPAATIAQPRTVLFVFGNTPDVSISDINTNYTQFSKAAYFTVAAKADSAVVGIEYSSSTPYYDLLVRGKTVYCKAYSIAKNEYSTYYDIDNKLVFPSLSASVTPTVSARLK